MMNFKEVLCREEVTISRAAVQSVLEREGEFLVVDRGGPGNNCDEQALQVRVSLS